MGVPMAMGRPKAALVLSPQQREQLEGLGSSRSLPAGLVRRARIILLSASGKTNMQIARQMGLTNATVGKWRQRFLEQDVSGLHDELRPGRPRPISDARVEIDGTPHLAGLRVGAASAETFQALDRSIFRGESTGYCRAVLESTGKCCGFMRG